QFVGGEMGLRLPLSLGADHFIGLRQVRLLLRRVDERREAGVVREVAGDVQTNEPPVRCAIFHSLTGLAECLFHDHHLPGGLWTRLWSVVLHQSSMTATASISILSPLPTSRLTPTWDR